jgi:hypothetical protein
MIVNFKTHRITWNEYKLAEKSTLIKKTYIFFTKYVTWNFFFLKKKSKIKVTQINTLVDRNCCLVTIQKSKSY